MKNKDEAINSYISDMVSLEKHIGNALESQIKDLDSEYPVVTRELRSIHGILENHVSALESLLQRRGGDGAGPLKKVGSALLGFAAGAVDLVRGEKLPKNLRDDYTACSLATISYTMLHTTALSLGEREVADLAHRHLADYARVVMTLHNAVPSAVIKFLQDEGLPATEDCLGEVAENIRRVWTEQSGDIPHADEVPDPAGGRRT